eukprot:evm.model.scf_100EXC.5 EVM.evm.TU.scf_100EXC.5   scf_100EXC:42726-44154(-)
MGGDKTLEEDPVGRTRKLLYKRLRVRVKDGRVLIGEFHCIDHAGNIILANTYEELLGSPGTAVTQDRFLGLVMVPPNIRTECHVEAMPNEVDYLKELVRVG